MVYSSSRGGRIFWMSPTDKTHQFQYSKTYNTDLTWILLNFDKKIRHSCTTMRLQLAVKHLQNLFKISICGTVSKTKIFTYKLTLN